MTDTPPEVEAARALAEAWDALNSTEHKADVESLRELSLRVSTRTEAFEAAQNRLRAIHVAACANGTPAADNTKAASVIYNDYMQQKVTMPWADTVLEDLSESYSDDALFEDDEFSTPRAAGALND